jgi:hypothetical protein
MSAKLICHPNGCATSAVVSDREVIRQFLNQLANLYRATTATGSNASHYWADTGDDCSEYPLSPLAHVPGVLAALWTPYVVPVDASTIGVASYGFTALSKGMMRLTTVAGANGIAMLGGNGTDKLGLFGPSMHIAGIGRPTSLFVRAEARMPIMVPTSSGIVRVVPRLVYVRCGSSPIRLS